MTLNLTFCTCDNKLRRCGYGAIGDRSSRVQAVQV